MPHYLSHVFNVQLLQQHVMQLYLCLRMCGRQKIQPVVKSPYPFRRSKKSYHYLWYVLITYLTLLKGTLPPVYLHWIFPIFQFEISSQQNRYLSRQGARESYTNIKNGLFEVGEWLSCTKHSYCMIILAILCKESTDTYLIRLLISAPLFCVEESDLLVSSSCNLLPDSNLSSTVFKKVRNGLASQ